MEWTFMRLHREEQGMKHLLFDTREEILDMDFDDVHGFLKWHNVGDILVIGELGLWNGRTRGYKIVPAEEAFSWSDGDLVVYSDGKDIRGINYHHDGTNYYLYREIRWGVDIEKLENAILRGEKISRQRLSYYTKSLHDLYAKEYGWR